MAAIYDDKSLQKLHPWNEEFFTDPNLDLEFQESFKFIVHGISENNLYLFADNVEKSLQGRLISASVISDEKQGIFTGAFYGFILQVPANLVIASSANEDFEDMHVKNRFETLEELVNEVEKVASLHPLFSPDDLLEKTPQKWYNEIVILGSSKLLNPDAPETSVKVSGIFFMNDDPRATDAVKTELMVLANRNNIPFVEL
ncbi:MAG: hypothetical protein PVI40_06740 [Chlamydiota bacterium]|jgi:hypothetical protein